MNLYDAIDVIESAPGFTDETTPVGEAWATVLTSLSPPQPVPVSERLPGPEDCTAEGRCWLCYTNVCNVTQWSLVLKSAILDGPYSHWLPATALPLPGQEVEG